MMGERRRVLNPEYMFLLHNMPDCFRLVLLVVILIYRVPVLYYRVCRVIIGLKFRCLFIFLRIYR
jgi:hypothetical protein